MSILKAALFDMDGVICHTNPYHSEAFRVFFGKRGFVPTDAEFAQHMFGKSNSYIFSHFFNRKVEGEELKAFEEEKEGLFREIYQPHVTPIDGLLAFLEDLKKNGVSIGVATSAPYANLEMILTTLGIFDWFQSHLASENVTAHKPNPEVYLKSAANLGVHFSECVVFEDSFSGISAGLNAGMKVVGILTSHQPEELPECSLYVPNYIDLTHSTIQSLL